ncbi:DNA repair protein RecN [Thiohalophilus thiocyanatoxydans]|uniref:DNA repair protein RecN n=1 Tax=Thiohalophilus thiocyanatoxydans TaxID=381308 RepID=A0A4R8IYF7_9GAMM|nr:DNA repair protein RecN [Thiohalophilus thiocyanatoxydans]TDY02463.1 DNA replication and repair protein RecN [Thiohalophilus thiocyanatoxydans]
MLTHIHIWNFAIVEKLDLAMDSGLTVFTGETGAGKSILLDALGLALGDRADSAVIRHGAEKAEISVTFSTVDAPDAEAWLAERELASENECIIRRTISNSGPSKAFINGKPTPIQSLRELGEMLVDLHGQHEHQSLLKRDIQRQLLDDYAGHQGLLQQLREVYQRWQQHKSELDNLLKASDERDSRLELLRFQVNELEVLALGEQEPAELEQEHKRLANASRLLETSERVSQLLQDNEETNASQLLSQCSSELQQLADTDSQLQAIAELLDSALIQVREAGSELRHYLDALELDPGRLEWVEQRLADMHALARKHHVAVEELPGVLPQLQQQLDALEQADVQLDQLQKALQEAENEYRQLARQLSDGRQQAAGRLAEQVSQSMQTLGMEGGRFDVQLEPREDGFSPNGLERVEFVVSANPGQPLRPLSRVASGGELSRISLAIQVITAQDTRIPTLIFDEVDVGIGGRVAEIVGLQLRELAGHRQVLCVTHLPQVAALGEHHFQVSKRAASDVTISEIAELTPEQRVDEVARMLGGIEITDQTLSHAKEMIDRAQAG